MRASSFDFIGNLDTLVAVIIGAFLATGGALIAEIMVEKSQFEVTAPADGVLKIDKQADDIVRKGDVIGQIT